MCDIPLFGLTTRRPPHVNPYSKTVSAFNEGKLEKYLIPSWNNYKFIGETNNDQLYRKS